MTKFVYICYGCPSCVRVVDYIENNEIECDIINVQDEKPEIPGIQIFPALFIDKKLLAYGDDIIKRLIE